MTCFAESAISTVIGAVVTAWPNCEQLLGWVHCVEEIDTVENVGLAAFQLNLSRVAPYTPCGWGKTLLEALARCVEEVNRFPFQEQAGAAAP